MQRISWLLLSAGLFTAQAADNAFEVTDGHGFDWLHPETAQCGRVKGVIRQPERCEFLADGGFTGDVPVYRCPNPDNSEWLVFADAATCQAQLETMQANAP
jgi:hypothetical protein